MKVRPLWVFLWVTALLVALGRTTVPGHGFSWPGTYEALAHIWVGFAAGVIVFRWGTQESWEAVVLLAVLTAFETFMFLNR